MLSKTVAVNLVNSNVAEHDYKKKLLIIFCLGISSGLPFLLLLSTLSIWLTESGISKTGIGLFAWSTIPYTLKFLISPFIESKKLPIFYDLLGMRRSWMLFSQICLALSLMLLANTSPNEGIFFTAICAFLVGLFSACQDIVVEAYRIEILDSSELGIGASASVLGYRIGMLLSGAGAIYLAHLFGWKVAYSLMGCLVGIGIITTIFSFEPEYHKLKLYFDKDLEIKDFFYKFFINPFLALIKSNNLLLILVFLITFKMADTVLNVMTMPFLLEIGFSKIEIANVAKTFGIFAMIIGGILAGAYLTKKNLYNLLLFCAFLQLLASISFITQSYVGNNLLFLFFTMGIENITCGMSQVALIAYLSKLCNLKYTATHYALLSSIASFIRVQFSALGGFLADRLLWTDFYILVACGCISTILLLLIFKKTFLKLEIKQQYN